MIGYGKCPMFIERSELKMQQAVMEAAWICDRFGVEAGQRLGPEEMAHYREVAAAYLSIGSRAVNKSMDELNAWIQQGIENGQAEYLGRLMLTQIEDWHRPIVTEFLSGALLFVRQTGAKTRDDVIQRTTSASIAQDAVAYRSTSGVCEKVVVDQGVIHLRQPGSPNHLTPEERERAADGERIEWVNWQIQWIDPSDPTKRLVDLSFV